MQNLEKIQAQARQAAAELLAAAELAPGSILVTGCSSSEITGGRIGKASSVETAQAVFQGIYPLLLEKGVYLAAQCCEHLNRALIVEAACAEQYGYEPVCVRPQPIPLPWSTSAPMRVWISAARSLVCTCGMWRCRSG